MADYFDDNHEDIDLEQGEEMAMARISNKRLLSYCGLFLSLMTIAVFVAQYLVIYISSTLFPDAADTGWFNIALTAIGIVGVGLPIFIKLMRMIPDSERGEVKGISLWRFIGYFIICIAAGYIANIVGIFISAIIEISKGFEIVNPLEDFIFNSNMILMMIYAIIVAPFVEEIIFRKILLDKLRRFGDLPAILISSFAFGIFHFNLPQFFYATVLGILFAYITIRTNRNIYSIILHMMVNFVGTGIAPLAVANPNSMAAVYVSLWFFGTMIIGSVLFILNCKKIQLHKPNKPLVRKIDYLINPGTLIFLVIGIGMIVLNIVGS